MKATWSTDQPGGSLRKWLVNAAELGLILITIVISCGYSPQAQSRGLVLTVGHDLAVLDPDGSSPAILIDEPNLRRDGYAILSASNPNLATHIGYNLNGLIPYLGFDYSSTSISTDQEEIGLSLLTLQLGAALQLAPVGEQKTVPYLNGSIFTVIPSFETSAGGEVKDLSDGVSEGSSLGFRVGYGMDFFIAPQFAVGAEIGGIYLGANLEDPEFDLSNTYFYSSIHLSFFTNFGG